MNRSVALRHLCWKEARQVLPLIWMQLFLGLFFQFLVLFQRFGTFTPRLLLFAGMPSLFALGVGALLVAQEREQRTLDWLRWLPVSAVDIWRVKLGVALLALAGVWCVNLGLLALFWLPSGQALRSAAWLGTGGWEYVWPLQSVYFLLAGFATAWYFRSTLIALLALLPIAILPGLLGSLWLTLGQRFSWVRPAGVAFEPGVTAALTVVLAAVFLALGWRGARKALGPEAMPTRRRAWQIGSLASGDDAPLWTQPPYEPTSMLVWQFVRQNQRVLQWLGVLLLAALVLHHAHELSLVLILLATSWLGVLSFQGDTLQERIGFLAERGVSPTRVWWTRHAVPLSLLAVHQVLFLLLLPKPLLQDAGFQDAGFAPRLSVALVLLSVVGLLFVYGASQAVGWAIRSATIAAIVAPVLAGGFAAYGLLLFQDFGTPPEVLVLLGMLPWLLTWGWMRRWMDHRLGWGFWSPVAGVLVLVIVGPLLPLGWDMARQPGMPVELRQQLLEEVSASRGAIEAQELRITYRPREESLLQVPGEERRTAVCHRSELADALERFEQALLADTRPLRFDKATLRILLAEISLARMAWERQPDSEEMGQRYGRAMGLLGTLIERWRGSDRLIDQDGADLGEMGLVHELSGSDAERRLGRELYGRLVQLVGDQAGRNAARRRALLISWADYRAGFRRGRSETLPLGGHSWRGQSAAMLYAANPYIRRRAADYLTWRMLERLEHPEHSRDASRIRELAHYWQRPALYYGLGPGGHYFRADDPQQLTQPSFALPGTQSPRLSPGGQWHAGWERRGRELSDAWGEGRGRITRTNGAI